MFRLYTLTNSKLLLSSACSVLFSLAVAGSDWPMLGHDAPRSGGTADEIRPPFERKWYRLFPEEGIQSGVQPIIIGRTVFLGTLAGLLHALDGETGQDRWTFKADGPILHTAAATEACVVFGAADGSVHGLDATTGARSWRYQTGAAVWNAPVIHEDAAFIGSRDGHLYALELTTGHLRWKADTGAPLLNSPAVDAEAGRVYIGSEAMRVHAFALSDGHEVWRSPSLPGASMRGYHPVIAPDGSVLVTTQPVVGYDRFQALLLDMVKVVFGDFASWRHNREENARLRAANFEWLDRPATYQAQLDYLRERLTAEPSFQTFFVLDPKTGQPRFVAPIVASESMNGPGAPPVVTGDGRVIVKYQALLRSRYEHYSPFLNVGYLDTDTGHITPLMDQTRTYGWHDSLLLVHDEQCQLSLAGRILLNAHQDNVNALELETLRGYAEPFARNIHEPAEGEALAIRLATLRGQELPVGKEWLIRGTAVYGGGSVLDVPVAVAGDSFYYLPSHELNAGCALIAYRSLGNAESEARVGRASGETPAADAGSGRAVSPLPSPALAPQEWQGIQEMPWDWDTLGTARLRHFLETLPGAVPGTTAAPLSREAEGAVARIPDVALDEVIWKPAFDPSAAAPVIPEDATLREKVTLAVGELLGQHWRPLILPAAKAPEESYSFFTDRSETVYTLLLARRFLDPELRRQTDAHVADLIRAGLGRKHDPAAGRSRVHYQTPIEFMRVVDDGARDELAQLYPVWLWSRVAPDDRFTAEHWSKLRPRLRAPAAKTDDDCGNSRLAGLMAYCRLARQVGDQAALEEALPLTRTAMRARLIYELAHPRGGVSRVIPNGRSVFARWRRLSPDVARFLATHALPTQRELMARYVDALRPGWWLAWNVEQSWRNEAPTQLPSAALEIFTARALLLGEPASALAGYLDLPWCRADEFYIQKLALVLGRGE